MPKETLQHTMRSKVRVFEDGGIRLLRKGQKGLIHAIFSRYRRAAFLAGPYYFQAGAGGQGQKEYLHVQIPLHAGQQPREYGVEQK